MTITHEEIARLRAEVLRLQQHRTELDCRFVGQYGDSNARHCLDSETPKPCQRCKLEMANEALRADIEEAITLLREIKPSDNNYVAVLARRDVLVDKYSKNVGQQNDETK